MSKRFEWSDHQCNKWCKVHYYYDFDMDGHLPLPTTYNILTSTHGWLHQTVHVGPPGYYPRRPTDEQWEVILGGTT